MSGRRRRKIQARMKELGVKDEHALQGYFIQRIGKFLDAKGRKLIGWDEILEGGLAPNATVMSWRGIDGAIAAAKAGHDTVLSPAPDLYFDHWQSAGRHFSRPQQHAVAQRCVPVRSGAGIHRARAAQTHPRTAGESLGGDDAHRSARDLHGIPAHRGARGSRLVARRTRINWEDFQRRLEKQLRALCRAGHRLCARSAGSSLDRAAA